MTQICEFCGKRFDPSVITEEQRKIYGDTICEECWAEHPSRVYESTKNKVH